MYAKDGEYIIKQGEANIAESEFFIIESGCVRCTKTIEIDGNIKEINLMDLVRIMNLNLYS